MDTSTKLRDVYARKAISQIPRLLSLQDRSSFSPTYGCFHRDYWLFKTSDFPDAVRQFGVQSLALVYKCDFPSNPYHAQPKIRDWTIAGMNYWASIQHKDGAFDEFYPGERGWVGPTAFTTFTMIEAMQLLGDEVPSNIRDRVRAAIRRAAQFIAKGESEEDHLANHHAMACLAVWKAHQFLGDADLKEGFHRLWKGFLSYHNSSEGWSREYDGVDPGYLSATVSFLGKIYQTNPDPEIFKVLDESVEFCSYFVYPNGFYAGSMGSRNTLHFYCHGFEVLAGRIPMAAAIAEKMLRSLGEDKLVPPEIMSDRYVFYRVPEFLQAYLDYTPRPTNLPSLPYERKTQKYFPLSRIFAATREGRYVIANLAKGGVLKIFQTSDGKLLLNDCGWIGRLSDGRVVTSQWVDPSFECKADDNGFEVSGMMQVVPSHKLFTPLKNLIFRAVLVLFSWSSAFSHWLKGSIRKTLMLGLRPVPIHFRRRLQLEGNSIVWLNEISLLGDLKVEAMSFGDEFFVRYVPQSRYFQLQELDASAYPLNVEQIQALNNRKQIVVKQTISAEGQKLEISI
jgi:hypothetical protein